MNRTATLAFGSEKKTLAPVLVQKIAPHHETVKRVEINATKESVHDSIEFNSASKPNSTEASQKQHERAKQVGEKLLLVRLLGVTSAVAVPVFLAAGGLGAMFGAVGVAAFFAAARMFLERRQRAAAND